MTAMKPTAKKVLDEALALPEEQRADLAAALLDSLDEEAHEDVETAWAGEIARRIREVETGAVKPIPWDQAREMIFGTRDGAKSR